jgi:hypothetical protein
MLTTLTSMIRDEEGAAMVDNGLKTLFNQIAGSL